jgi:hypothetical protein
VRDLKTGWIRVLALAAAVARADVAVDFNWDGSNLNALQTLTLDFAVGLSGTVSLDAATGSSDAEDIAAVDAWDSADVGSVTNPAFFGASFSLSSVTASETGQNITLWSNDGGVLAIQGQNSGRIDGQGLAPPKPESLGWTFSGEDPGMKLRFTSFSCGNAHAAGALRLSDADTETVCAMGTSDPVTFDIAGAGFLLADGEALTFAADTNSNEGAGLAGFAFELSDGSFPPVTADLTPDDQVAYTTETFDGRTVWVSGNSDGLLYFDVPDNLLFASGSPVYARIEYHDDGQGRLFVEYDSDQGDNYKDAEIHSRSSRVGLESYATSYQMFEYAELAGGQNGGNDFRLRLSGSDGTPLRIASVQISDQPYDDESFAVALSKPWLLPNEGPVKDFTDRNTIVGKVMAGYQGWFATPNDRDDLGWRHWGRSSNVEPAPDQITIDAWPYLEDYTTDSLYPAGSMTHQDGRSAYLFSSRDPAVVRRHFRWMRKHNIDGVYLQRFVTETSGGVNNMPEFVLDNVRKAASAEGRVWAIEYDVSGLDNVDDLLTDQLDVITNDWNYLVNECGILDDPRYLHEDGKPVLFIWGFGTGNNDSTAAEAEPAISWFAAQDLYLIGGTARGKINDADWEPVLRKYDQLLEWMERDLSDLEDRIDQLEGFGMKLLPHAWPGFSWNNLQQTVYPYQYTARDGGSFYWTRIYNAVECGADQIFLGMFDEYDEATQIMPMSDNHPDIYSEGTNTWGHYIDNEGLDSFWYLRLSGAAREMLNGQRALSSTLPLESELTPVAYGGDDATCYLATNNVADGLSQTHPADGETAGAWIGGHSCRTNANGDLYLYFDIDDSAVFQCSEGQAATVEVEFYDADPGARFRLQYDSVDAAYTTHSAVYDPPGSNGWKNIRWNIEDGYFGNRQNGGSDLRIGIYAGETAAIRRVSVFLPEEQNGDAADDVPAFVHSGETLAWPELSDATGWRLYSSGCLVSNVWNEVSDVTFTNGAVFHDMTFTNDAAFYRLQRPARD